MDSPARSTELPFEPVEQPAAPSRRPAPALVPPIASPVAAASIAPTKPVRRFAGLTYPQLFVATLALLAAIWAMWATSRIFALEDRRVVSVRLSGIVNDFVTAEARSGSPPEELALRTRAFMVALDTVLKKRAASGQVVLVGEAVVASSVPDVTADVMADLSKLVKMPVAASLPPAMPAPMSMQPSMQPVASSASPPGTSASPFDPSAAPSAGADGGGAPAETGPQQ